MMERVLNGPCSVFAPFSADFILLVSGGRLTLGSTGLVFFARIQPVPNSSRTPVHPPPPRPHPLNGPFHRSKMAAIDLRTGVTLPADGLRAHPTTHSALNARLNFHWSTRDAGSSNCSLLSRLRALANVCYPYTQTVKAYEEIEVNHMTSRGERTIITRSVECKIYPSGCCSRFCCSFFIS